MQRTFLDPTSFSLLGLLFLAACSSGLPTTNFTNPDFDFAFVETVAVLPFENLSSDRDAGFRATRLMITELLASQAVDVVEPGEVQSAMVRLMGGQYGRVANPDTGQLVTLAQELGVQAVIMGTVTQSEILRSGGGAQTPVVTLDVHMVEAETGRAVWAVTHTEKGGSIGAAVLGTGGQPISNTTRRCVRQVISTLIE